jgi:spore coat polysaccharide biosynthesis protein SpsF (cytidylyltransferase family)
MYTNDYDSYIQEKADYELVRNVYNEAYEFNEFQKEDFFRLLFEDKKVVPTRPCKPTLPVATDSLVL